MGVEISKKEKRERERALCPAEETWLEESSKRWTNRNRKAGGFVSKILVISA